MVELIARKSGHRAINDEIRAQWQIGIETDPERFDILFYAPKLIATTVVESSEVPLFGELQADNYELEYKAAEKLIAVEVPSSEYDSFGVDENGENVDVDALLLRINSVAVVERSVIELLTENELGEDVLQRWYVLKIDSYGSNSVASIFTLIPFNDAEDLNITP